VNNHIERIFSKFIFHPYTPSALHACLIGMDKVAALLQKYNNGTATPRERALVESWYLKYQTQQSDLRPEDLEAEFELGLADLQGRIAQRPTRLWPKYAIAASLLCALSFAAYFALQKPPVPQTAVIVNDVDPGGNKAILTLSNGQKVVLGSRQGRIASQGKTNISLTANGSVNYEGTAAGAVQYNTLTVPIGNRRDMTLSDGTEVSLDAGSSITFPVAFNQAERAVSVTGQVYFKVKHDAAHPFQVKVKDLLIRDIGTEFNINAYEDEGAVRTTLVEGIVKVNDRTLAPGQQAIAIKDQPLAVKPADVEAVTAWRSDNFALHGQDLRTTMRQLARWYNVTVVYDHAAENERVLADISRQRKLSVILHAIEQTNAKIKFRIEGHQIIVTQ
jgi:transmembrane sensor